MSGIDLSAAFAAYLIEGRELAEDLEQGLLRLESRHDIDGSRAQAPARQF